MTHRPAPCVLWSWMALLLLAALLPTAILWITLPYLPTAWQGAVWLCWSSALTVTAGVYLPLRRRRMRYVLSDTYVQVSAGVLFATTRYMEREAVRQVTLLQGPIERRCAITYLLIRATGGYLLLEGVPIGQAQEWCRRLYLQ